MRVSPGTKAGLGFLSHVNQTGFGDSGRGPTYTRAQTWLPSGGSPNAPVRQGFLRLHLTFPIFHVYSSRVQHHPPPTPSVPGAVHTGGQGIAPIRNLWLQKVQGGRGDKGPESVSEWPKVTLQDSGRGRRRALSHKPPPLLLVIILWTPLACLSSSDTFLFPALQALHGQTRRAGGNARGARLPCS